MPDAGCGSRFGMVVVFGSTSSSHADDDQAQRDHGDPDDVGDCECGSAEVEYEYRHEKGHKEPEAHDQELPHP